MKKKSFIFKFCFFLFLFNPLTGFAQGEAVFSNNLNSVLVSEGDNSNNHQFSSESFSDLFNQGRIKILFNSDWKFTRGDVVIEGRNDKNQKGGTHPEFDDSSWRDINLPHDWSIEGPFEEHNPAGSRGAYLPTGIGWYRKHFIIPEEYATRKVFVEFEGIYKNSDVWVNGQHVGYRPYGYIGFEYDITPHLNYGVEKNVLAVRVDNSQQPNSRWYSGSGIYRHVWLTVTGKLYVTHWGTYVTTPEVSDEKAVVLVKTNVMNENSGVLDCVLQTSIVDRDGKTVASVESTGKINDGASHEFEQKLEVNNPQLWSTENPYLYKIITTVKHGSKVMDTYETPFGIRTILFDANRGFLLNGKSVKIKGVCLHHDLGCLGAAAHDRAIERRIEILKEMGCNGIRTAHNPHSKALLEYCDKHGMLVMAEIFDEWSIGKNVGGNWAGRSTGNRQFYHYHQDFDEWHERDLSDMIRRDRNHPSVILWSVGNEVPHQGHPEGVAIAKKLVAIAHREDPTRPVTAGCQNIDGINRTGMAEVFDVVGYNYKQFMYEEEHPKYPDRKIIATETSPGRYLTHKNRAEIAALEEKISLQGDNNEFEEDLKILQMEDRELRAGMERMWKAVRDNDFIAGMFLWTGIEYLGEADIWPARHHTVASPIDISGFPKDEYYFYKSQWTDNPMVHIEGDWNRQNKKEINDIVVYSNCDEVELILNGRSLGKKDLSSPTPLDVYPFSVEMYYIWKDVPYEPGVLMAIGKREKKEVASHKLVTTGKPAKIVLTPDRTTISADGRDLSHIKVEIMDEDGNMVPDADNKVTFRMEGPGVIIGLDSGDETSHEDFKSNERRAFKGKCLAIIQSKQQGGKIDVTATSPGLNYAHVVINSK